MLAVFAALYVLKLQNTLDFHFRQKLLSPKLMDMLAVFQAGILVSQWVSIH